MARDPARTRIAAAIVELVGSRGYAETSIEMVCARAEVTRGRFERVFADMEDCLLSVREEIVAELCERVTSAYGEPLSWHDRIWAAGWAGMRFLLEDPLRARFLVVEANAFGGRPQEHRDRLMQRAADFIDAGREELDDPHSVSRCTAEVAAGAIYSTILSKVEEGAIDRREDFLPELVYLAVMPYLGFRAAEDELLVRPLR